MIDNLSANCKIVNMKTVTISTRLSREELFDLDELAESAGLDRSGMARSLVRRGLKEMKTEAALKAYAQQRASLSRASEMAELSPWDFLMKLQASGGTIHYDIADFEEDLHANP